MTQTSRLRSRARMVMRLVRSAVGGTDASQPLPPHGDLAVFLGALAGAGAGLVMTFLGASPVDASGFGLGTAAAVVRLLAGPVRIDGDSATSSAEDAGGGGRAPSRTPLHGVPPQRSGADAPRCSACGRRHGDVDTATGEDP
ncbi:hypothetical protein [Streptomyces sp. YKOK-I1]